MFNKVVGEVFDSVEWNVRSRVYLKKCERCESRIELEG